MTPDDVEILYRAFLGRPAESRSSLEGHADRFPDAESMGLALMASTEFQARFRVSFPEVFAPLFPLTRPQERVDTEVSAEEMNELCERVKACWSTQGETQPFYSVLTGDDFRTENFSGHEEAFWATGWKDAIGISESLARFGYRDLKKLTCVEYGCGVGRMTTALSGFFRRILGYDVSPGHLQLAAARAESLRLTNVEFRDRRDDPLGPLAPCDVFVSFIVLQHNPPPIIKVLLKRALEALRPGGLALFQLLSYYPGYRFIIEDYLSLPPSLDFEMHCLPQQEVFALAAEFGCEPLEVRPDSWAGDADSFTFAIRKPGTDSK